MPTARPRTAGLSFGGVPVVGWLCQPVPHPVVHSYRDVLLSPDLSTGAAQANFFVHNGGGWSKDGKTLPGALDMEYGPPGKRCYGLSPAAMTAWIADFVKTYHAATTRYPVIYTSTSWWKLCTGNSKAFGANSPLWVARYASTVGELPAGWATWTIWQYANSGPNPGDQDVFNGNSAALAKLASG